MRSADFKDKLQQGPVAVLTVMPNGMLSMRRSLVQWLVFLIVVNIFCAYIAGRTLPAGTPYLRVFQIVGATAFIGYALALCELSIWYRRSWSLTLKAALNGLIYGALTGGTSAGSGRTRASSTSRDDRVMTATTDPAGSRGA